MSPKMYYCLDSVNSSQGIKNKLTNKGKGIMSEVIGVAGKLVLLVRCTCHTIYIFFYGIKPTKYPEFRISHETVK